MEECVSCGNQRNGKGARGWCTACYGRWIRAGKPEQGPPPLRDRKTQTEDLGFLLTVGVTDDEMLARRLGLSVESVRRYRLDLKRNTEDELAC